MNINVLVCKSRVSEWSTYIWYSNHYKIEESWLGRLFGFGRLWWVDSHGRMRLTEDRSSWGRDRQGENRIATFLLVNHAIHISTYFNRYEIGQQDNDSPTRWGQWIDPRKLHHDYVRDVRIWREVRCISVLAENNSKFKLVFPSLNSKGGPNEYIRKQNKGM